MMVPWELYGSQPLEYSKWPLSFDMESMKSRYLGCGSVINNSKTYPWLWTHMEPPKWVRLCPWSLQLSHLPAIATRGYNVLVFSSWRFVPHLHFQLNQSLIKKPRLKFQLSQIWNNAQFLGFAYPFIKEQWPKSIAIGVIIHRSTNLGCKWDSISHITS